MHLKEMILPVPKQFEYITGDDLVLGTPGKAFYRLVPVADTVDELVRSSVCLLENTLSRLLNVPKNQKEDPCQAVDIVLALGDAPEGIQNPDQGYTIETKDNKVVITGFGPAGLYYGAVTLTQCLKIENNLLKLPGFRLFDWPDLATRGHFIEDFLGSDLMTLEDWKHMIDRMSEWKMNRLAIGLYGCWEIQYGGRVSEFLFVPLTRYKNLKSTVITRYYSPGQKGWVDKEQLTPMFEQDFFGELIAYGKSKGIVVFPLFNSYGHNTLIPRLYPEVSAKEETGEASLTGFCTSNPKTYDMLFAIYDDIIDRYLLPNGIDSFHLGLDEVSDKHGLNAEDIYKTRSTWCKCEKCREISRKHLLVHHAVKLAKYLKSRGMKNIYIYHDMLIVHDKIGEYDSIEYMMQMLKENDLMDCVVIDWWTYSDLNDKFQEKYKALKEDRPDMTFRCVIKPWNGFYHWISLLNPLPNIATRIKMGIDTGVEGVQSYSSWDESFDRNHACLACYSWHESGTGPLKRMTERYAMQKFPAQYAKAVRAFELMDIITEARHIKREDGSSMPSKNKIINEMLPYYQFCHVNKNKAYPRAFPGEPLFNLNKDRAYYLRNLREIASMAKEASALFKAIAEDPQCDRNLAGRFLYEVENYACLAEDYLALFDMMDIAASDEYDMATKIGRIKAAATDRKHSRLSLMARLECTKEAFLLSSGMREQSLFMQFFADLEGYLANTESDDIVLDFFDMRYLESEAYKKLK